LDDISQERYEKWVSSLREVFDDFLLLRRGAFGNGPWHSSEASQARIWRNESETRGNIGGGWMDDAGSAYPHPRIRRDVFGFSRAQRIYANQRTLKKKKPTRSARRGKRQEKEKVERGFSSTTSMAASDAIGGVLLSLLAFTLIAAVGMFGDEFFFSGPCQSRRRRHFRQKWKASSLF
jgi:hypothetical protein